MHGRGDIIQGTIWFPLIEEPQSLLSERQRQISAPWDAHQGRDLEGWFGPAAPLDLLREAGHGGLLEEDPQGHLDPEDLAQSGNDAGGDQRVTAQVEEVVMGADTWQ